MGHTRLGDIPKSKKWAMVVSNVVGKDEAGPSTTSGLLDNIAQQTLIAARGGLEASINDWGLRYLDFSQKSGISSNGLQAIKEGRRK